MEQNMLCSVLLGVISGLLSSIITWIILNLIFITRVKVDDEIQYGKRKNYIRIYNKSLFDVYEVICYLEFKFDDGSSFYRMDNPLPNLKRRSGKYIVALGRNLQEMQGKKNLSRTDSFFSQDEGEIVVTITYQNRFGIKHTPKPAIIKYVKEPRESTDYVESPVDSIDADKKLSEKTA